MDAANQPPSFQLLQSQLQQLAQQPAPPRAASNTAADANPFGLPPSHGAQHTVVESLPNSALSLAQAILVYDTSWRPGGAPLRRLSGLYDAHSWKTPHTPWHPRSRACGTQAAIETERQRLAGTTSTAWHSLQVGM